MTHPLTVLAFARSTSGFYFGEMLAGINREVAAAGGRLVVVQTLDPGDVADLVLAMPTFDLPVTWDDVDGAVVVSLAANAPFLEELRAAGKPVVLASHTIDGFDAPVVLPDNRGGTFSAVEHLMAHGHRRIGFVGNLEQHDMAERHAAWQDVMALYDLPTDGLFVEAPDSVESGGHAAADVLAADPRRPEAVMVATDRSALGLVEGLRAHGLRVPHDVAVVGFDAIESGAFSSPTLSSVSQRFDEVGALAGRLVLARIAGTPVAHTPHVPADVLIAARGSCGCTVESADPERPAPSRAADLEVLSSELTALLRSAVPRGDHDALPADLDRALDVLQRLLSDDDVHGPVPDVGTVLTMLERLTARPDVVHRVAHALTDRAMHAAASSSSTTVGARLAHVGAALWRLQAGTYLSRSQHQERLLTEQFRVASGLLDSAGSDPASLDWLAGTHVRAGVLALWDGDPADGQVRLAGVYDPDGEMPPLAETCAVSAFPPRELVSLARPENLEACFVVPVRTRETYWGLLAVVGDIDTTSSRDTYHHWAQLLCAAFDGEALERAVRASEARYAHASRAAMDGLWEWEVGSTSVYTSDRCLELLGAEDAVTVTSWTEVTHPDDVPLVRTTLARALARPDVPVEVELRVRCTDGHRWRLARALGVGGPDGRTARLVGSLADVHPRKDLEQQLREAALYDTVTGLANRRLFLDRLGTALAEVRRGSTFAVLFLDLDGFKLINDSLGHLAGDHLLRVVGERLSNVVRAADTAARFGGDEFAVLLQDLPPQEVLAVAERVQAAVAAPVHLDDHEVSVTASLGIATSSTGYDVAEDVLRDADIAMYRSKETRRGSITLFDREMHERAAEQLRTRAELRTALAEGQFVVHFQPVVPLDGSPVAHVEALVRWDHPRRGLLPPGAFLPAVEEDEATAVGLGRAVLDQVCAQLARWRSERPGLEVTAAVNLAHHDFWSGDLVETLRRTLARHGVPGHRLVLEITESVIMADPDAARAVMDELRATGARLHMDDFGTGHSSLTALRSFPVDALKVDGSFVRELGVVAQTTELVRVIVDMAHALDLEVVAEHVEEPGQADHLRALGCTYAQGWLYSPAAPAAEVEPLLGTRAGAADAAEEARAALLR